MKNILILSIIVFSFQSCCSKKHSNPNNNLIRQCPDEWIQNRMPGPGTNFEEYFIVNGERKEMNAYDVEWVKRNCNLKPTVVQ